LNSDLSLDFDSLAFYSKNVDAVLAARGYLGVVSDLRLMLLTSAADIYESVSFSSILFYAY